MNNRLIFIILIVALVAGGLLWLGQDIRRRGASEVAIGGPFQLTLHNGDAVTEKDFRNRPLLIFFGFTHCPDVCPVGLQTMTQALTALAADAGKIYSLFISVDPERDTPKALREFLSNYHPFILGLTGTPEQIEKVADEYKVYAARGVDGDEKNYLMNHSAHIYLMGSDGKYIAHFPHNAPPAEIVAAVQQALK